MLEVVEEEGGGGGAAPAPAAAAAPCMSPIGLRHDASDDHQSIMIESLTHSALNDDDMTSVITDSSVSQ